jgi:cytochrome c-type biogenesis protein
VARHRTLMGYVEKVMGVMLLVFAILIATNSVTLLSDWLIRNFDWSATLK